MPFDPAPLPLKPWIPSKEAGDALADLAAYLRTVPAKAWDYSLIWAEKSCGAVGCAIGHGQYVPSVVRAFNGSKEIGVYENALGADTARSFFLGGAAINCGKSYGVPNHKVTPAMVADRIDHWLATGAIR